MSASIINSHLEAQKRSRKFLSECGNPNIEPVQVYSQFPPNKLAEIHLIRELSQTLQAKKEEEDRKAEAAAAEDAKEKEAQKKLVKEVSKEEPDQSKEEIVNKE